MDIWNEGSVGAIFGAVIGRLGVVTGYTHA